ncbi:hypothetical protein BSFA1_84460 (plasmid) [Burkholderia sp. SFA1]|nr:hypothetical protein BYI23_E000280 [Burkholderia sp. YI23]BBQ03318.1 hypothetical protein BSFA1_84460 [Burkholderia sp. SFA1]
MTTSTNHSGTPEATSFKEAYAKLKQTAETMRSQQEPDIDALVPMVDSAVANYAICTQRIEAVRLLLNQKLGVEGK